MIEVPAETLPWLPVFILALLGIGLIALRILVRDRRHRREAQIVAGTPPRQRAAVAKALAELETAESENPSAAANAVNGLRAKFGRRPPPSDAV